MSEKKIDTDEKEIPHSHLLPALIITLLVGGLITLFAYPYFIEISSWIGVAIMVSTFTIVHLSFSSHLYPGVAHAIILIAFFQLVFAAWWSYYYPINLRDIGDNLSAYLSYAVPFTCAMGGGMMIGLISLKPIDKDQADEEDHEEAIDQRLAHTLDLLVWGGIGIALFFKFLPVPPFASFIILLLSSLRYVGGMGLLLKKDRRALSRFLILFAFEIYLSTSAAAFHQLILLGVSFFVIFLYRFRLSTLKVFGIIMISFSSIIVFEYSKLELRNDLLQVQEKGQASPNKILNWGKHLSTGTYNLLTLDFDQKMYHHLSERYNQGWIVNLVMNHVPNNEAFAKGDTILRALYASFLPRFLAPEKYRAGGREYFIRYTGYIPSKQTSMNIALSGELYANFGKNGGIVSAGFYGLILGLIIRVFYNLSRKNVVWWAFLPYILFWAFKSEEGLGEIINWITKSALVMLLVTLALPSIREALWLKNSATDETHQ